MSCHRRSPSPLAESLAVLVAIATLGCASLQQEESETDRAVVTEASAEPTGTARGDLPEGAELEVRLDRQLSSKSSEAGDPWRAVLEHDVTDGSRVLLTRGAVVSGEVTRAGAVEVEGETRQVIALEPMTLHVVEGDHPIEAEVVEADVDRRRERFSTRNIAIVGGSIVGGAILGELLADEALLGAILGGAGGTVVAIATAETEIVLPQGAGLTLRIQEPVRIAGATPDR